MEILIICLVANPDKTHLSCQGLTAQVHDAMSVSEHGILCTVLLSNTPVLSMYQLNVFSTDFGQYYN